VKYKEPAILGGVPEFSTDLPAYNTVGKKEIDAAIAVMKTGVLSGFVANPGAAFLGGTCVLELENSFCKKFGSRFAVSVNSATSGLHASLAAAGIGFGDEVIVSPYSMSASATSIVMCGAVPIFVDIEPNTFCLNSKLVAEAITEKTKAIIAVNIFGQAADLTNLKILANKHKLTLIEDNAQAPAAKFKGQWTGTIGDMGVFSLNRHKTIQCGEGGVVITNNEKLAHRLRMVRNHGEALLTEWLDEKLKTGNEDIIGYNYRLTDLQAAIAIPQFSRIEELNKARIELAEYLTECISNIEFLQCVTNRKDSTHVYYLYPILFRPDTLGISRNLFVKAMIAEGFPVSNYVRPLYHLPLYRTRNGNLDCYNPVNFPVSEKYWKKTMIVTSICRPPLGKKHIDKFITSVKKIECHANKLRELESA
jgi:perosamine synthetase